MIDISQIQNIINPEIIVLSIVLGFCVGIIKKVVKVIVEKAKLKTNDKWDKRIDFCYQELFLPVLPIILGALCLVLFPGYPVPAAFSTNTARAMIGAFAGLLSSFSYAQIKKLMKNKADSNSIPPGP